LSTCRLEPNEAISESRLCGMFHVSRLPRCVSRSHANLAGDGLIDIFPAARHLPWRRSSLKQVREGAGFARHCAGGRPDRRGGRRRLAGSSHTAELKSQSRATESGTPEIRGYIGASISTTKNSIGSFARGGPRLEGVWATVQRRGRCCGTELAILPIGCPAPRRRHHRGTPADRCRRWSSGDPKSPLRPPMKLHLKSVDHAIARLRSACTQAIFTEA